MDHFRIKFARFDQVFDFHDTPMAHQLMKENKHKGKLGIRIQAPNP